MDRLSRFWNVPRVTTLSRSLKTAASLGVLALLLALVALTRCWNVADVFVDGKTFFVDPDCYSRMTRVQRVLEHPGTVVHQHEFENWPTGTLPHTTAPFDYLTAGLAGGLRVFTHDTQAALDLAGAVISPLLGVLTALFLWFWARRLKLPFRIPMLLLFAVSPILVHGTALGRPDHQSLLILCMAVALGTEAALLEKPSRVGAIAGGLAWGLGLWVSLYEPLVLLAVALLLGVAVKRRAFFSRERAIWLVPLAAVLLLAALVDGWHSPVPDPVVREYFANWSKTIGELANVSIPGLLRWTGWLLFLAPLALIWQGWRKHDSSAWIWLGLVLATAALTCWQARWGYFLALVFVMALPCLLAAFPRRWLALVAFAVALWPVAAEWDIRFDQKTAELRAEQRMDNLCLYDVAQFLHDVAQQLHGTRRLPILAPWWQSPALAYWSGQPCVAGSSHESLSGTVDASRFFLSTDANEANAILARRRVVCVVAYEPDRVNAVSGAILGKSATEGSMGELLYRRPSKPPRFLELAYSNAAFRVFLRPDGLEP